MCIENIPDNEDIRLSVEADMEFRRKKDIQENGVGLCDHCGEAVLNYEDHYGLNGVLVHGECVSDWLEQFKK